MFSNKTFHNEGATGKLPLDILIHGDEAEDSVRLFATCLFEKEGKRCTPRRFVSAQVNLPVVSQRLVTIQLNVFRGQNAFDI